MRTQVAILVIGSLSILLAGTACSAKEKQDSLQETPANPAAPAPPGTPAASPTPPASADIPAGLFAPAFWRLTELMGKPIPRKGEDRQDPSLRFVREGNKVSGFGGCNQFGGGFKLADGNRLQFTQVFATQMACEDMDIETEFLEVLDRTDSFHLADGILTLLRARMAPLAKFEAVAPPQK